MDIYFEALGSPVVENLLSRVVVDSLRFKELIFANGDAKIDDRD